MLGGSSASVGRPPVAGNDRERRELTEVVRVLAPRWFVLRSHRHEQPLLLQSRTTLSWLKGPLTRGDLRKLRGQGEQG